MIEYILEKIQEFNLPQYFRSSFGQIRTASTYTLLDNVQMYSLNANVWSTQTATGGTVAYNSTSGVTALTVTGTSGSTARMRTNTYFYYQAGKALRTKFTLYHSDAGQANQQRNFGYFDTNDGIFFRLSGTDLQLVKRSSVSGSPVELVVNRADWNGDKVDGSGPSKMVLDITKGNIYEIDLQWLSVGLVHCWIHSPDGPALIHTFKFPNSLASPYMRSAQLPLQMEVVNTGASSAATLNYICSAVEVDGGLVPPLNGFTQTLAAPKTGVPTAITPIMSIHVAPTFQSRTNRKIIIPARMLASNTGGRATISVYANATLTGASWTSVDATNSGAEYDVTASAVTGGKIISRFFLPNTSDFREIDGRDIFALNGLHMRRDAFDTASDSITIAAAADTGTVSIDLSVGWQEVG